MRQLMELSGVLVAISLLSGCSGQPERAPAGSQEWQTEARIQVIDDRTWVVGTHLVTISRDASVAGKPAVGSTVRLNGRRTDTGELIIDRVQMVQDAAPTARPTQPKTETPAPPRAKPTPQVRPPTPIPPARAPARGRREDDGEGDD